MSFVTNVPCAHVTQSEMRTFFNRPEFHLRTRARDNLDKSLIIATAPMERTATTPARELEMLTDDQKMKIELSAAQLAFEAAIDDLVKRGGDIRFFTAAMLAAALRLHVDIEGPDSLLSTITKMGTRELSSRGDTTLC